MTLKNLLQAGNQWKCQKIHFLAGLKTKSKPGWELLSQSHLVSHNQQYPMVYPQALMPEKSGDHVFIQLETNPNAVLAGHLALAKLFQIDSVLPQTDL